MHRTGVLLSVLAFVAFQAPWVACACSDDASFAPLLLGVFEHHAPEPCCEPVAHLAHGRAHGCHHHDKSRPHCHGIHEGRGQDGPRGTDAHVGFRLPLSPMVGHVTLKTPAPSLQPLALLFERAPVLPGPGAHLLRHADPPDASIPPAIRTERLLL